jgi:hypothetical protein
MLSNYIIISENKYSRAEDNQNQDYYIQNSLLKNYGISNNIFQDNQKAKEGPNINLKCFKKTYDTDEEKSYITQKIRTKKKTELCKNWEIYHDCYFKDECSFAHGMDELRLDNHISGSKNKLCKTFQEKGYCVFGKRCNFRHVLKEKRLFTYQFILENNCNKLMKEMNKKDSNETLLKLYKKILFKNKIIMYVKNLFYIIVFLFSPRLDVFKNLLK